MKSNTTRREFLQSTSATVAATGLSISGNEVNAVEQQALPPHRVLDVPGLHAYPLEHSIAAGDSLELCVSSSLPYRLSIVRLGLQIDDPAGDMVLERFDESPANPQPIHPGSYIHVEQPITETIRALTLECWIRLWDLTKRQGIVSQTDDKAEEGFALGVESDGRVFFRLGDGQRSSELLARQARANEFSKNSWHHVVATWDGMTQRIFINGTESASIPFAGPLQLGNHSLRIGAIGESCKANYFLDGDIAMPAIYSRALPLSEIHVRFEDQGLKPARGPDVLACWSLDEERGAHVADVSGSNRNGRIVNHATWMIGGPSFQADVPRFGDYDPTKDPSRGHGLRLASDDLYDCSWEVTHRWNVPADARQGVYDARFEFVDENLSRTYHCTFIVCRRANRKQAPILLLLSANTWRAYSGSQFAMTPEAQDQVWGTGGIEKNGRGLPAYNLYRDHATGQGTYQVGLRMPWPAAGPYVLYGGPTKYSHLARADRFTQVWLEEQGYDFDVVSDLDLHRHPEILRNYKAFMVVGHNEYWSLPMYQGTDDYLRQGGNLIVLSGNAVFWRVSFNDEGTVMECRKADAAGNRVPMNRRGEAWHSHDGLRGGMLRDCGWPGVQLIGLDCLGFNAPGNIKTFGPYVVEAPDHVLFNQPEELNLKKGESFGQSPDGSRMANGHEFDVRPSTFARLQEQPSIDGGVVPEDPVGIQLLANGQVFWKEGGSAFDYFFRKISPRENQGGELIYWERPEGGRVFNAGTIASGWVLSVDLKMAALLRNVLAHFGVSRA